MKKTIVLFLLFAAVGSAKSQLANTNWKGTLQTDQTIDVIFRFGNDTLKVINTGDLSTLEVLTYNIKDSLISFQKVYGQSDCGTDGGSRYKYEIKNDAITFTLVEDNCEQRAAVLNNSKWAKVE